MSLEFVVTPENAILCKSFKEGNFKIIEGNNLESKLCYIVFSGNGIYWPNTLEIFEQTINTDYYEWKKTVCSEYILNRVARIILVRDLFKTWYLAGINEECDSIEKVCFLLQELTTGYKVVTVGNSAGGFMASIVGAYLKAEHVLNFGGQWTLKDELDENINKNYFLKKGIGDGNINKWFNILDYVSDTVPIFWFYSYYCETDKMQADYYKKYKNNSNIYDFAINSTAHGYLMLHECNDIIISKETDELIQLHDKYENKVVHMLEMAWRILPFKRFYRAFWEYIEEHHKSIRILRMFFIRMQRVK